MDNSVLKNEFANVFAVAWDWGDISQGPTTLADIEENYNRLLKNANLEESYCQPIPEIIAAVDSFVTSREAREGIYIFLISVEERLMELHSNFSRMMVK